MNEIDVIENKLCILEETIDFEEIINEYVRESDDYVTEPEGINILEFSKNKIHEIQNRFVNIYNFDVITPVNGYSTLNIASNSDFFAKKYLHRFLTYKSKTGGEKANSDGSAALFEEISANAVKSFLGESSKIILVGEDRTPLTKERLDKITFELKENNGIVCNLPHQAKDDGVDFIVYKSIDGRNIGNVIILGQACVGKHYFNKKPIKSRWVNEYIKYSVSPPITLLSIVSYLEPSKLQRVHSEFGDAIVFDRGRIMRYYDSSDISLNCKIKDWVDSNIIEDE